MTESELELREQLVRYARQMLAAGLVRGTSGNISARPPGEDWCLLTLSGVDYELMRPEDLVSVNLARKTGPVDLYTSGYYSGTHPNGQTTPFGGLMSDPFEKPVDRTGTMFLVGARYNFGNDERTKVGFEVNHGSKYWFNFAQGEDDIIAPKTNTRGNVFESYLTHRINSRFIFKADFIRYLYDYSGSGWHLGAPKALDSTPLLGFPTYSRASMVSVSLITRF